MNKEKMAIEAITVFHRSQCICSSIGQMNIKSKWIMEKTTYTTMTLLTLVIYKSFSR